MDPQSLVGQQFDRYLIKKHIARGGMADVYLAYEADLDRHVAVKVMLPAYAHQEEFMARFIREGQSSAHLIHPSIVQVYATGITPTNQPFMAMEYCERGPLSGWLDNLAQDSKLLPTVVTLALSRQIADALRVAHGAGIVHRDLKPANILLRKDGSPVLTDLGIATMRSGTRLTQTGALLGTPHYMSPEQASGKPVDGRSDLYSLGVILYELLAGRRPYEAEESLAILHKQIYEESVPLQTVRPGLSGPVYGVVQRCMQKDPARRYQNAQELVIALDQALANQGVSDEVATAGIWLPFIAGTGLLSRQQALRNSRAAQPADKGARRIPLHYILAPIALLAIFLVILSSRGNGATETPIPAATQQRPATVIVVLITATPRIASGPTSTQEPTVAQQASPIPSATPAPPTATPVPPPILERLTIGYSVQNSPIEVTKFGNGPKAVVFVGGLHAGAAPGSVEVAERAVSYFTQNPSEIPGSVTLHIVISANPDSLYAPGEIRGRMNARSVDLNRNWECRWIRDAQIRGQKIPGSGGTSAFSEPETSSLANYIQSVDPVAVVFWYAKVAGGLVSPGNCQNNTPASALVAGIYGLAAGYPVADYEDAFDQTLNGDATNWLDQQGIPSISVLLPDYVSSDWNDNLSGIKALLRDYAS